ncbi:condensation domain-containing protein [Streptomyces sp. bgisy034]|uniref:condensation domain-containing protein n=1 Tax=Streptomyces sp. bgisy034 TaxID=3413774 RepID=UPI003EBD76FA
MDSGVSLQQAARLTSGAGRSTLSPLAYPYRVTGPLDLTALHDALREVVQRHTSLRTVFPEDEQGRIRVVEAKDADVPMTVENTGPLTDEEVYDFVGRQLDAGVDVRHGPMLRASALTISPENHIVVFVVDHVAYDGVSHARVQTELAKLYQARISGHPDWRTAAGPVPAPYEEFCQEQRTAIEGAWGERCRRYWYGQFAAFDHYPPGGRAPTTDGPVPVAPPPLPDMVRRVVHQVPPERLAAVRAAARAAAATPFSAWATLLLQTMDRLGAPVRGLVTDVSGRIWPSYGSTVGLFAHGLPIYANVPHTMPAEQAIAAVYGNLEAAVQHALPLRELSRDWLAESGRTDGVVDRRPFIHFLDETIWRFDRTFGPVRFEYFESHGPFAARSGGAAMLGVKLEQAGRDVYLTLQADARVNDHAMMKEIASQLIGIT